MAEWRGQLDLEFDGTTIMAKNATVNRFNEHRLDMMHVSPFWSERETWGNSSPEWKIIPELLELKPGALVMILTNDHPAPFTYANGDLGHVVRHEPAGDRIEIDLVRNGARVSIPRITRYTTANKVPYGIDARDVIHYENGGYYPDPARTELEDMILDRPEVPHYDADMKKFVLGAVRFHPLRLGWASTVHKSQGLSLDNIQIDIRDRFFGSPGMAYVALSRARFPEGLRIVGLPMVLAQRVKIDENVRRWL